MKRLYFLNQLCGFKLISRFFLFILILFFIQKGNTQEISFSQFDYNPLFYNPANTGNFNGDWRISGTYRNQWSGAGNSYRTAVAGYDQQVYILNQRIGAGLYLLNDESGAGGIVYNKIFGSMGYNTLIGNNMIALGFQLGFASGKVKSWEIYDPNTGQFTLPSGEPLSSYNSSYLDFNFGFAYKTSVNIFEPEIGVSLKHLNKPSSSFYEDGEKEPLNMLFYTLIKTKISDAIYFSPKILYTSKSADTYTVLGAETGFNVIGNRSQVKRIFGGFYIKNGLVKDLSDLTIQAGTTFNRIDIALSYDLPMTDLSNYGSTGAFEISFIYKSISTVLNSYSIPCERY